MRIKNFKKIHTASFKNFSYDQSLVEFGSVNVALGWNGSGKTVISRILRSFEKGFIVELPPDSEFTILTDTGTFSQEALSGFQNSIRVFNEDFINEMVSQGSLPYVIYVGENPVDFSKKTEEINRLQQERNQIKCVDNHSSVAEEISKQIKRITGMANIKKELEAGDFYAYNKASFEKRIDFFTQILQSGGKIDSYLLDETKVKSFQDQLANQEYKQKEFEIVKKWNTWLLDNTKEIDKIFNEIPLHEKSDRIDSYNEDEDIYNWIREGVEIHRLSDDKAKHSICLFCNSSIKNSTELLKHFTNDIILLNQKIEARLSQIESGKKELEVANKFYYSISNSLKEKLDEMVVSLFEKKKNPIQKVANVKFEDLLTTQESIIEPLKDIAHQLEKHYVAEVYEKYIVLKNEFNTCLLKQQDLTDKILIEKREVSILKAKAKNVHTPAEKLNELLKVTFPYKQIELKDSTDEIGYEIYRSGQRCDFNTLSEGERNFIALAYFLISINTEEDEKKLEDSGVVVIDDPISSLDKNSIFQIFSILANEVCFKPSRQYIFLTHNLDFFAHLCHHFKEDYIPFYQIIFDQSGSKIQNIDEILRQFKSDYQYSVSLLWNKRTNCSMADAYHMVNLLRRVWETFLYFKFGHGDLRSKLDQAYKSAFEEMVSRMKGARQEDIDKKKESFNTNFLAMYRFINYGSHEFSSVESFDVSILLDASRRISDFFEMLNLIDKHHFDVVSGS